LSRCRIVRRISLRSAGFEKWKCMPGPSRPDDSRVGRGTKLKGHKVKRISSNTAIMAGWLASLLLLSGNTEVATAAEPSAAQLASGPNSSLLSRHGRPAPLTKTNNNWLIEAPTEQKELRKWDIVTVIVKYSTSMTSEGEMDRKKKANGNLVLSDWVLLNGLHLFPDPQGKGDPKVSGSVDNKMRSEAGIETVDKLQFTIACHVVCIRPNGNLILEGHRSIDANEEHWDLALTGEIRPDDVLPDNTVLSEDVANLNVEKQERGHVRDGYRRGWLLRLLDKYQPF